MLATLDGRYSSLIRTIFVIILWVIHAQTMVTRSVVYLFYIGALSTRPDPSPADVNYKNHVVSNIHVYRWVLVANNYLPVALTAMLIDSLMGYPWNVLSMVIVHTLLQSMLKRLAHLLHINPPFDDIQHCRFLILATLVFIFELSAMVVMLFFICMEASAHSGRTIRSVHDRLRCNNGRKRIPFSEVISWSVILPYGR